MNGDKFDQGKVRMDLLDFAALEGLSKVLTMGAEKYAPNNWRKGIPNSKLIGSLLRHLSEHQKGNDIDPESGLPHMWHVGCNWMFLTSNLLDRPDMDDRETLPIQTDDFEQYKVMVRQGQTLSSLQEWQAGRTRANPDNVYGAAQNNPTQIGDIGAYQSPRHSSKSSLWQQFLEKNTGQKALNEFHGRVSE